MPEFEVVANYQSLCRMIRDLAEASGRNPDSVRLLPVSKFFPVSSMLPLVESGVRIFGENRVPELEEKYRTLPPEIQWHFIGTLQANKARRVVRCASVIQSVDSIPLLERLERIAGEEGKHPAILLEVNISGEASKSGISPAELPQLAQLAAQCENLKLHGLMTMAPEGASESVLNQVFGGLARWRNDLEQSLGRPLPELSMGMSGDFPAAIRNGATLVRIGTAIFGSRLLSFPREKKVSKEKRSTFGG